MALLSGCVVGPKYQIPAKALYNDPRAVRSFSMATGKGFSVEEPPDHWWRLYDDPELDGYVTEALAANTDLRAADANFKRATYVIREAQAGRRVQTSLSGNAEMARVGGYTLPELSTPYSYALGVGISYPLDLAGGIKRGIEAARADSEAAAAARDMVRVTVAAAVTRSYADVCSTNVTLAAANRVLALQRSTLEIAQRLFKAGRGTAFDVTRAKAAFDQGQMAIPPILAMRQTELLELGALMGRPPGDYPRAAETCATSLRLERPLPIGSGMTLLRRRPDIRAAERTLAAATANIGVQTAELYPDVSIGGSVGVGGPFSGLGSLSSLGGSIGPMLSWTFPNRSAAHARIAEAGAEAQQASAQFDGSVIEALRQAETALSAYAHEIDRDQAAERARTDGAEAVDQAGRLFRFGRTSFLDLLTAQSNLAAAEAASAQSRATLIDRQVEVFLALGGGWQAESGPEMLQSSSPVAKLDQSDPSRPSREPQP